MMQAPYVFAGISFNIQQAPCSTWFPCLNSFNWNWALLTATTWICFRQSRNRKGTPHTIYGIKIFIFRCKGKEGINLEFKKWREKISAVKCCHFDCGHCYFFCCFKTLSGRDIEYHLTKNSTYYEDLVNGTILQSRIGESLLITHQEENQEQISLTKKVDDLFINMLLIRIQLDVSCLYCIDFPPPKEQKTKEFWYELDMNESLQGEK